MQKTVPALEFQKRASTLIAINKLRVDKVRDPLLLADLYGLCDQCVHWPFIIMLVHRDDVKERRGMVNVDHFREGYKFLIPIRTHKITSIQIGREFSFYTVNILPEMPEGSSVSYWYTIINPMDAVYEIVIKRDNFYDHATPGGAPYILPRLLR
ncbi:MAG TPA: hypothetical protein VGM65_02835 [Candidatus Udaeobacter sp.]